MVDQQRFLEDASTQHSEWVGTVALDDANGRDPQLDRVLGVSSDKYWIVGFSFYNEQGHSGMTVYAIDRSEAPDFEALQQLAARGPLPVLEIEGFEFSLDLFNECFKRLNVVAVGRSQVADPGHRLAITQTIHAEEFREQEARGG